MVTVDSHPLLDPAILVATWPQPLGTPQPADWLVALGSLEASTPFPAPDDAHKKAVRDLLRQGGFKPAGRNKPCWEYMRAVAAKGRFPVINPAVDATNVAAMHGALPVSTVDLDRLAEPLRIGVAEPGASYVFNASGQELDLSGLLCLFDAAGPCSNSVKDSQRSKTDDGTTRTLTVVWGTNAVPGRTRAVAGWQRELFERLGAEVRAIPL